MLCLGAGFVLLNTVRGDVPAVGDCMTDAVDPDDMQVVDCGAGDAVWTVIGTSGEMTRGEFSSLTQDDQVCQEFPDTEQALWVTEEWLGVDDDTTGEVVCLRRSG